MGVPKFFRWISERYPCLSELVKEHQIPDFDNLYLDMNGIIHTCSHPNDHDPHFRITEEKICKDVFHYIEILFHMIKPQKLFFMAVDGVAPRAKQNQQRGRRFRTAKDAEMTEKRAKDKGEDLPDTARFDSNCITPGTVFMTNLQEELKLYVAKKISTDSDWKKCTIILSGHETPGEGEHKIMDYIRYMKSQPDYDPNTRHCLYGLDADLIMLGLCSHEPHFALLREEVKFGRGNHDKRISTPEETTFYLLHLSLMREYLEMEFTAVKGKLPFPFDLECIIDDWVLMGFLVGNDFIPPLPDMHINEGALPILYRVYMEVLPTLDGYLNEQGTLNLPRFQTYMKKLAEFDINQFRDNCANLMYFQAKTGRAPSNGRARFSHKVNSKRIELIPDGDESESKPKSRELASLIQSTNDIFLDSSEEDEDFESMCFDDSDPDSRESIMMMEFRQHKNNYYVNKLEYDQVTPEVMREQAECYVRAIQWILNYYYNGVCSWSWFYPHHYAPYISDVKDFASLKLEYDMGSPFLPFQQLLAVLPSASKELLPVAFQHLMVADDSPLIDYYPLEFSTDMNGKKQEWEALVLIPFIDEAVLLSAMEACYGQMTPEERKRNTHGPMCMFTHSPDDVGIYPKTLYNPSFSPNHAKLRKVKREEIFVEKSKLVKGLCPNIDLNTFIPGFPTFKHIPYSCYYNKKQVKVFESPSRGENAIVRVTPRETQDIGDLAAKLLGTNIYVCWPHLVEAKVVSVSNPEVAYALDEVPGGSVAPTAHPMSAPDVKTWHQERASIAEVNLKRRGIDVGNTDVLVRARLCIGRVYEFKPEGDVELVKQWAEVPTNFALQVTVSDLPVYDRTVVRFSTMADVFPVGTRCFLVSRSGQTASLVVGNYGQMGEVIEGAKARRVKVKFPIASEPDLAEAQRLANNSGTQFMQANQASASLGISAHLLSRITGNIFVTPDQDPLTENGSARKVNIALHLKYSSKNEQIPGYTRRDPNGSSWLYSMKTVELVRAYMEQFGDVIDYLCNHPSSDDMLASQLFPLAPERLNEITAWLKAQEYSQIAPQACGSEILDADVVKVIDWLVAESLKRNIPKFQRMQVKPHLLFTPDLSNGIQPADPSTTFRLFDRVINCRKSYSVPLGLKGVIIGICKPAKDSALYDVVFDEPFPGGLALNCSEQRGYRVPGYSLINISHGQRMETGEQAQPKSYSTPSYIPPNSAFTPVPLHRPLVPNAMVFNTLGTTGPPPTHELSRTPGRQPVNDKQSAWRTKQPFENGPGGQRNNSPAQKKVEVFSILSRPQRSSKESSSSPNGMTRNVLQTTDYKALWVDLDNKKQPSPKPDPEDPSVALRLMLRIDGKPVVSEQQWQPMMLQQIFQQFTIQPAVATNVTAPGETKSACGQLLSLFQARNLGTPRYSYVEDCSTHTFQATVKLPDGRAFTGQAGATKEKASEMAALKALDVLRKEPSFVPPTPPAQWCATPATLPMKISQVPFSNDNKSTQVLQSALPTNKTPSNQLTSAKNLVKQAQTSPFMPQFAQPAQQGPSQALLMPQFGQPTQQTASQAPLMPQFGKPVQQTSSQAHLMPQFGQPSQRTSSQAPLIAPFGKPTQQTSSQAPLMPLFGPPTPQTLSQAPLMSQFGQPAQKASSQASMMPQFAQSPQQTTPFAHPVMQVLTQAPLIPQFAQPQQQVAQFAHSGQQASTLASPMPPFAQAQKTVVHQQQVPFMQQTTIQPPSRLNQNTLIQQVPTQMAFLSQTQNVPTSSAGPLVFQRSQQQGPYIQQPAFVTFPHTQMQHMQQMFPTNTPPRLFPGPQHGFPVQAINPKPFSQLQVRMQQTHSVISQQATLQRTQQTNGNWRGSESSQPQMAFVPLQAVKQQRKEASPPKQTLPKLEQLSEVQPIPPVIKPITVPSSEKVIDGSPVPVIVVSRKICANFPGVKKKKK